jgi:GGDEF domain-containing protein
LRETDIVARYGVMNLSSLCRKPKLKAYVVAAQSKSQDTLTVTISGRVATDPKGDSQDGLFAADAALYQANNRPKLRLLARW